MASLSREETENYYSLPNNYVKEIEECLKEEHETIKDERKWVKELLERICGEKNFVSSKEIKDFYTNEYPDDTGSNVKKELEEVLGEGVAQYLGSNSTCLPSKAVRERGLIEIKRRNIVEDILEKESSYIDDLKEVSDQAEELQFPDISERKEESKYDKVYNFWEETNHFLENIDESIDEREEEAKNYFRGSGKSHQEMMKIIYQDSFNGKDPIIDGLLKVRSYVEELNESAEKSLVWGW